MAKPDIHAQSSAKLFGGKPEDYMAIHSLLDCSKESFPDVRHRCLMHNSFFIEKIIPMIFGERIVNSDGNAISTKEIAERHVMEDFALRFIPTPQDWLSNMELQPWMNNGKGQVPESARKIESYREKGFKKHPTRVV
jgi:hypothetical protein